MQMGQLPDDFGRKLAELRQGIMTQSGLGEAVGVDASTISRGHESGDLIPSLATPKPSSLQSDVMRLLITRSIYGNSGCVFPGPHTTILNGLPCGGPISLFSAWQRCGKLEKTRVR